MAETTFDDTDQELIIGPIARGKGAICLNGAMTAGFVTVSIRPTQSQEWFPADEISAAEFQTVNDPSGSGYGYVSGFEIPVPSYIRATSSYHFTGDLSVYLGADDQVEG
jgi:hypothetical protein